MSATAEEVKGLGQWVWWAHQKLEQMENRQDRGPEDYAKNERDLRDLLASAVREGARMAHVEVKDYRERGDDGDRSWQKWMLTLLGGLALAGIGGAVLMFGKLSALQEKVESIQVQVNDVKRIVEPRYRGAQ